MFKFITHRHFLINLLAAILLVVGLMFLFLWSLGIITHHGDHAQVPSVKGKVYKDAQKMLEDKGFDVEVIDSVYIDTLAPFAVVKQSPEADMLVKSNRTVYLTINRAQPPLVEMPDLVGFSFRNAELYMKQLGLKLGDTTRKPDIAKDAVLEQLYNGQPIKAGTKIFMGSTVSFVLGDGLGEDEFDVPDLVGLTYAQARDRLKMDDLSLGSLVADGVSDTMNAYVYKQNPALVSRVKNPTDTTQVYTQRNKIRSGQSVDLFLRKEKVEASKEAPAPDQ